MDTQEALNRIVHYSLEDIMGDAFGRYSKYIIQDRAIPDIRDGLKPVQRRILYSMYKEKNTYDKPTRKSAKTVGDVIGNFHPHGDISIYEAMVRMSQNWKMRHPYIDMQGNNGSIDGDPPAAYRYTEARLSKISNELLKDIDKDTVNMAPNFDDTLLEPTVLPAKYPNLLVNGATGISAGYATNIPPHNLGEVIDATIYRIDNPNCRLETLMNMVKGPDFPTGGIAIGADGIRSAYTTGRGKIIVRSKTHFEEEKNHVSLIVTEIPYEVNKALLVRKIDELRIDKTIDGIIEVRDETDKEGLRIAIDLKPDANKEFILNYLLKNTDLQVSYSFNMVAICDREPKQVGLIEILDAYICHQQEFILRRTKFDLNNFKKRLHIVEGLIKCISILDEVVQTIRHSKDKADAKKNLVKEYGFTEEQAEAIVVLQLYRLTNTDVTLLEEELKKLQIIVAG
ncbi:MAG TPA: DNA topoisomerase 4 subunit A, partial [Candidatus Faecenecus gallistercoris]|nr:DNA topoisomerase 4 subunit A [Candidatus Faecenecus gallistercoris]